MNQNLYKILLAVVGFTITAYYFLNNPIEKSIFPPCIFKATTGLYCLGCGGQRAFHSLLHGNFELAFKNNLLIFVVLPIAFLKILEEIFDKKLISESIYSRKILIPLSIFILAFWISRNLPYAIFENIRPCCNYQ